MKTSRTNRILSFAFLGLLMVGAAASAMQQGAVLGANGELYIARGGAYGDLFPGGNAASATTSVLALDVVAPGATIPQRLLVPGTEGDEVESSPYMVFEEDSNTVFLVWETRLNDIHSILNLSSFDGTTWSKPIEITGNPFAIKQSPKLAITRDTFQDTDPANPTGAVITKHRTVLHLIWEEDSGSGLYQTYYEPVILEEGVYLGWNPYRCLNDLDTSDALSLPFAISAGLVQAPTIQNSGNGETVVAAFASLKSQRLVGVAIDVLPKGLGQLADTSRATIIDTGARLSFPSNIGPFATQVRNAMLSGASDFEPEYLQAIADRVYNLLLSGAKQDLQSLADASRATIIDTGVKLSAAHGLRTLNAGSSTGQIVEIDKPSSVVTAGSNPTDPQTSAHLLQLRVTASRPVPQVGTDGVSVFISQNGGNALVAWTEPGGVLYRESADQGWNDVHELKLSDSLNIDQALTLLAQRAFNR